MNGMILGLLFGLFSLAYAGHYTFLSRMDLSRLMALCCFIGALLPVGFYRRWFPFSRWDVLFFNLLGVGPVLCGMVLWINFFFHGPADLFTYKVIDRRVERTVIPGDPVVWVELENEAMQAYPQYRKYEVYEGHKAALNADRVQYRTAIGLLGWRILLGRAFLERNGSSSGDP